MARSKTKNKRVMKSITQIESTHSKFNAVVCSNYRNSSTRVVNWIVDYEKTIKLKSDIGVWKIKQLKNN